MDRNSLKEINVDIDFINHILEYINNGNIESACDCLTDWRDELYTFKEFVEENNL